MEMSPNQVRTATFSSARKGYDTAEVSTFLDRTAEALESAQNHANAMEARARAAVSKLQELSANTPTASSTGTSTPESLVGHPEAETISRTLLLAQRAADEVIAEARVEADRLVAAARDDARAVGEEERDQIRSEVDALVARREFLQGDVEQLENFLLDQRERLRSAATSLVDIAEKVPGGLGYLRPPLLSASDDETPSTGTRGPSAEQVRHDAETASADDPQEATEAMPVIVLADEIDHQVATDDPTPESPQLRLGADEPGAGRPDPSP